MKRYYDSGSWLLYTESAEEASAMMKKFKRRTPATYSKGGERFAWSWTFSRSEYRDFFREDRGALKAREIEADSVGILDEVPLSDCFVLEADR